MAELGQHHMTSMGINKYPNDYEMLKYIYDESAF